jgi:two-component sensor histidine kinase/streptogramin lyase
VQLSAPDVQIANARAGLADQNVATIYQDHAGVLWVTTITGRVYKYSRGRFQRFHFPSYDNLQFIGTYQDHNGAMWFGTVNAGAIRLADGRVTRFSMANGLRNNGVQALFEDTAGNLWIGTSSGISRWDGAHIRNFYLGDGLSYGWIRSIAEDQKGDLLVGTDRGINRFRAGKFIHDGSFRPLAHDRIWSIFPGADNALWIGTRGNGLVRIKDGRVARLTTREGLLSNSIFQIVGHGDRLWLSGSTGIFSASLAHLNSVADGVSELVPVISYPAGDDIEPAQMNGLFQPSACVAQDGELWFPSVKGAVQVNPRYTPTNPSSPVRLESFSLDGELSPPSTVLAVPPGRHRIQIEFTSIALRSPEQISFRYRLDGFDEGWTAAGRRRAAEYDNLPPGRYRFQVIANNPQGSSEASASVLVLAHFYRTGWFYALGFACVILCSAGLLYFRKREARNRYNLRLEERARIAREMHDTVIQGCLGVSTLVEVASSCAGSDPEQMLECLDNARIHLRLTIDEARQALSDLRHDSFDSKLEDTLSRLTQTLPSENVLVGLEVEGTSVRLSAASNRALALVAREAIRNAIAHGAPGAVQLALSFSDSGVRLEIWDDGCGFDLDPVYLLQSSHFGILGMRERIEQVGGSFEIESRPGAGTRVVCAVPIGKDLYPRDRVLAADRKLGYGRPK